MAFAGVDYAHIPVTVLRFREQNTYPPFFGENDRAGYEKHPGEPEDGKSNTIWIFFSPETDFDRTGPMKMTVRGGSYFGPRFQGPVRGMWPKFRPFLAPPS